MKERTEPFSTYYDEAKHLLSECNETSEKKVRDMISLYALPDPLKEGLPPAVLEKTVYRVYKRSVPPESGSLLHCLTVISPGEIGGELFMTAGHNHKNESCAEIYFGLAGRGLVLLQKEAEFRSLELKPGSVCYIPGGWNHRTVNLSLGEELVFLSVWPAESGYVYEAVLRHPFSYRAFTDPEKGFKLVLRPR